MLKQTFNNNVSGVFQKFLPKKWRILFFYGGDQGFFFASFFSEVMFRYLTISLWQCRKVCFVVQKEPMSFYIGPFNNPWFSIISNEPSHICFITMSPMTISKVFQTFSWIKARQLTPGLGFDQVFLISVNNHPKLNTRLRYWNISISNVLLLAFVLIISWLTSNGHETPKLSPQLTPLPINLYLSPIILSIFSSSKSVLIFLRQYSENLGTHLFLLHHSWCHHTQTLSLWVFLQQGLMKNTMANSHLWPTILM